MFKIFKKKDKNKLDSNKIINDAHTDALEMKTNDSQISESAVSTNEVNTVHPDKLKNSLADESNYNNTTPQSQIITQTFEKIEEQKTTPASETLDTKLEKSRNGFGKKMKQLFSIKKAIDEDLFEDIETTLLMADVGANATMEIVDKTAKSVKRRKLDDSQAVYSALKGHLEELAVSVQKPLVVDSSKSPFVILIVGVNGVGKTTTIAKLARNFKAQGKSVMLAAGDTFRAAAVEQLKTWGQREGIPVVAQTTGSDSASVIFDAMSSAKAKGIDILIADTAGRLHTQANLMQELGKISRVMKKNDPTAPHETMIVVDGGTGQNAISQIKEFHKTTHLTGITITKLDGTAKGGVLFNLAKEFGIPVRFIGVGEKSSDLKPYIAKDFVNALLE
jgi:fused signal recognition particle receptor